MTMKKKLRKFKTIFFYFGHLPVLFFIFKIRKKFFSYRNSQIRVVPVKNLWVNAKNTTKVPLKSTRTFNTF